MMTFHYKNFHRQGGEPQPTPLIPITLKGPNRTGTFEGLLDSGADTICIPSHIAEFLGVESSREIDTVGIGGALKAKTCAMTVIFPTPHHIFRWDV
ncbi:MAG: hypothetical protein AABX47_02945 [Nanoarchaeota archaeon]